MKGQILGVIRKENNINSIADLRARINHVLETRPTLGRTVAIRLALAKVGPSRALAIDTALKKLDESRT